MLALLLVGTCPGLAPVASAAPSPVASDTAGTSVGARAATIRSVTEQLHALAESNEALTERYLGARIETARSQQRLAQALRTAAVARQRLETSRRALARLVSQQYRRPSFSRVGTLLISNSGEDYLSRMESLAQLTRNRAQIVTNYAAAQAAAATAADYANRQLADATKRRTALAAQHSSLQTRIEHYKRRLATLTAAQRAALLVPAAKPVTRRPAPGTASRQPSSSPPAAIPQTPAPTGSTAAAVAVRTAMAQQGKPYVYATAGPSTFDCSGLTMFAWAAAGVSIPHQSQAQYRLGSPVSADALAPGDLVFFYQDLHHVGLYIGSGLMVHAPTTGDVVKVTALNVFGSEYMGARRLG